MSNSKNNGSKPKYTSADEITGLIDAYFKECEGHHYVDPNTGNPVYDKYGYPVIVGKKPPTVTGLALALGFTNRVSLLNYQAKAEFREVITKAKSRIEQYTEERLFDKDGANGAKFSLQANFKGWKEEKADTSNSTGVNIIIDIPKPIIDDTPSAPTDASVLDPQAVNQMIKQIEQEDKQNGE